MSDNAQTTRPRMLVDIVADPICPWCYVGLKSFQHARAKISDDYQVLPRIRAYELATVPQDNLVGPALVVYWPFTSHWGRIR